MYTLASTTKVLNIFNLIERKNKAQVLLQNAARLRRERNVSRNDTTPGRDEQVNDNNPHHEEAGQENLRQIGSMSANRRVLENLQQQSVIKKYLY